MGSIKFCWSTKQGSARGALNAYTSNLTLYYKNVSIIRMNACVFWVPVFGCMFVFQTSMTMWMNVSHVFACCLWTIHINSWQLFCIYMLFESHLVHFYMLSMNEKQRVHDSTAESKGRLWTIWKFIVEICSYFVRIQKIEKQKMKNNKKVQRNRSKKNRKTKTILSPIWFCFVVLVFVLANAKIPLLLNNLTIGQHDLPII